MLFKFRCYIEKALLELPLGSGLKSVSLLSDIKRLYNQVANHILMIARKHDA